MIAIELLLADLLNNRPASRKEQKWLLTPQLASGSILTGLEQYALLQKFRVKSLTLK